MASMNTSSVADVYHDVQIQKEGKDDHPYSVGAR
jgi:hypothetical protein